MPGKVTAFQDMFKSIDRTQSLPFGLLHADENVTLILYSPNQLDEQSPHDQDEYYFVASGEGEIDIDGKVTPLQLGDAIFVPANTPHKFVNHSEDFSAWGLFYGPIFKDQGLKPK